jgi:hypothetical protein
MNQTPEELFAQFLQEISSTIEQLEHYDVVTNYVFTPERSSSWIRYKKQMMRDVTYPYNNHLDLEALTEPFFEVLKREYANCKVDYIEQKGDSGYVFERKFVIDWS